MDSGLITGAYSLRNLEDWQSLIAHNLANSSTVGFQKNTFQVNAEPVREMERTGGKTQPQTLLPVGTSMRPQIGGEMKTTQNPYDLSIMGEGYFSVRGPQGQVLYTRDGEFHRSSEGILVNKTGFPLLADGGPIELPPEEGPFTVARDGTISQNGEAIGRISVYRFDNPEDLQRGNGSFVLDPDNRGGARLAEDIEVIQGQLEMSSVSPMSEMVSMIQVSRAYEMTQKLIQENDDRLRKAIEAFSV
ncbi:MAG: flagellar hook-basal body protein [Oceanipulchritudo sp.]